MSKRRDAASAPREGNVLVFGESDNDRRSIAELVVALRKDLTGRVRQRRQPIVLIKNAKPANVPKQVEALAAVVAAESVKAPVRALVVHEDCDAVEPAHVAVTTKIERELRALPCPAYAAAPAFEMEAWWLQWPKAGPMVCTQWRELAEYRGRHVGTIPNAKEELRRALAKKAGKKKSRPRPYEENDSADFARIVRERGWASAPEARADSYSQFQAMCARL